MTTTTQDTERVRQVRRGVGPRRAASIAVAMAGALLVWVVADPLAGVNLVVGTGADAHTVGPGAVLVVGALAGLAAVGSAALLERVTARSRRIWFAVAGSSLIASLLGPLGAASIGAGASLATMHLVVGAALVIGVGSTLAPECEDPRTLGS